MIDIPSFLNIHIGNISIASCVIIIILIILAVASGDILGMGYVYMFTAVGIATVCIGANILQKNPGMIKSQTSQSYQTPTEFQI